MPGVLVLVQQHRAVPLALAFRDFLERRELGGQRHLVREVERRFLPFSLLVGVEQREERGPEALRPDDLLQLLRQGVALPRRARGVLDQPGELLGVAFEGVRRDQVLAELAGEGQQVAGDGRGHLVGVEILRPGRHDSVRQLPGRGLGEQPDARFDGQAQAVLGHQPARVGVVGQHHGLAGQHGHLALAAGVQLVEEVRAGEPAQPGAHPVRQLPRGLAGEGQAQHPVRQHDAVGHQPHDPCGHGLGLARACSGYDQRRLGGSGDDLGLLWGRFVEPERFGDLEGTDGHRPTSPQPSRWQASTRCPRTTRHRTSSGATARSHVLNNVTNTSSYLGRELPHHPGLCVRRPFGGAKRAGQSSAYSLTWRPDGWTGQVVRAGQRSQSAFSRAV